MDEHPHGFHEPTVTEFPHGRAGAGASAGAGAGWLGDRGAAGLPPAAVGAALELERLRLAA